jgi:hypothetical protein
MAPGSVGITTSTSIVPGAGKKRRRGRAAAVALLFIPLLGGGYYFGYHTGTISILATDDAVQQFASLNITFEEIALHSTGNLATSEWTSIKLTQRTIDLTKLSDNITAQVGLDRVQAGRYTQLRILVGSADGTLLTGEHVIVRVPGGELKTETPFDLKPLGSTTLVVRLLVVQAGPTYSLQPALGSIQAGP